MIKFILCSSVAIMLFFSGIINADEHFPFLGEIKKGAVNVRAGANTNFESIDKLSQGAEVIVLGQNFEWYKIQMPITAKAFVRADYVTEIGSNIGALKGDKVNVRARPKSESSSLGQVLQGEYLKLIEKKEDWWQIEPPAGAIAWVHADFVKLKSNDGASVARKPITKDAVALIQAPKVIEEPKVSLVAITGVIEHLDVPIDGQIHYQVAIDGEPRFYLQDVPHLDRFGRAQVKLEGIMVTPDKPLTHPVVNIKKVTLVL